MTVAVLVVAACDLGSPSDAVVAGQTEQAPATATPPVAPLDSPSSTPVRPVSAARSLEQLTPTVEAPTVVVSPGEGPPPEAPTPTSIPVTVATEADVPPAVEETEITLDLGLDPSRPGATEIGQTPAQPALETADEELSTVDVVRILAPSVVQIANEKVAIGAFNRPIPAEGVGTGVIIDATGHILTSSHVVEGARTITVTLSSGERHEARLVGSDTTTDVSIIAIDAEGLHPAKLGSSADLEVGEDVVSIGHALGLRGGPTVSKGVVSALGRSIPDGQYTIVDLIQTDASVNPGNSGGPLTNMRAEVVGINAAVIPGSQGIGFAINIDDTKVVAAQLIANGRVERGFLGITPFNLTAALADRLGVPVQEGIVVVRVESGSGAESADIRVEDVIVKLSGEPITNTGELSKFMLAHPPGSTVEVEYYRRDAQATATVTLGTSPG